METIRKPKSLEVAVNLEEITKGQAWPNIAAYVFSRSGRLLAKQKVKQEAEGSATGKVELKLEIEPEALVVKIGPDLDDVKRLEKYQPITKRILVRPDIRSTLEFSLPKPGWWCWIKVPYWVTGTVEKRVGDTRDPICHGEVDIYDVDMGPCFLRLPDPIIERIRDSVIDILIDPPPVELKEIPRGLLSDDDDWCGTKPKPFPFPPKDVDIIEKLNSLPTEWAFAKKRFEMLPQARARLDNKTKDMDFEGKNAFLNREIFEGVKNSQILYTNTAQFRDLLIEKFLSFRFCLCWYPWIYWLWWPYCYWYSLEKLGTVKLQPDGSFSAKIMLSICRSDIPDLWFVVRQKINGVERVIYARHPVPCNTYWNHPSGKPVHLIVTDPLAVSCHEEPETDLDPAHLWIVPLAIGNYSLKRIYGTGAGSLPADNAKIGLYESISTGLGGSLATFEDGPFGGMLGLRLLFSPALETAGVKYYRIKYRASGSVSWTALDHEVMRHYSHYDAANDSLEFKVYQLGPKSVGSQNTLFEIPPDETPNHATEPEARWYVIDATVDLINGYLDSTKVNNTFVDFKIELFDSTGVRVDPATFGTSGIAFKLPANADVWETITTVDPATVNPDLVVADPEDPSFRTFIFRLQIDNRVPTAIIDAPVVKASGSSTDPCGIIPYMATDRSVDLPYQARHPRKFAMYQFTLYRSTLHLLTEVGQVGDSGPSGSFNINVNLKPNPLFPKKLSMLDSCESAAFSENLYIWNMAFNGWSRVSLDAGAVRAFALVLQK